MFRTYQNVSHTYLGLPYWLDVQSTWNFELIKFHDASSNPHPVFLDFLGFFCVFGGVIGGFLMPTNDQLITRCVRILMRQKIINYIMRVVMRASKIN